MNYEDTEVVRKKRSRWPSITLLMMLLIAVAVIYWLRGQLELMTARASVAELGMTRKQKELEDVTKARAEVELRLGEIQQQNTELIIANEQLSTDVREKSGELEKLKATTTQMEEKLKKEIGSGEIRLRQVGGRLQVELVDKILFDSGDARISKRGEEVLMRVGQVLSTIKDKQIQVSGHTDNAPISEKLAAQFPTNWELSVTRATNVVRFLGEKAGVPEKFLAATGHGPHRPVASNATPQGRARNRRIEILLTPLIQPVPVKSRAIARSR
jgi:chemotaxis protein MotB